MSRITTDIPVYGVLPRLHSVVSLGDVAGIAFSALIYSALIMPIRWSPLVQKLLWQSFWQPWVHCDQFIQTEMSHPGPPLKVGIPERVKIEY